MSNIIHQSDRSDNHKFNLSNIKNSNYAVTMLNEALRTGKITETEIESIQLGYMDALSESISLYTHDESSSVLTETASLLLASTVYTVDAYLISLHNPEEALKAIKETRITQLHIMGMRILKQMIFEATGFLVKVRRSRIDTQCNLYNDTIDSAVVKALKTYNIASFAQISGQFNYPLSSGNACANTRGIYYIKFYLLSLYEENSFCEKFSISEIDKLYRTYCDINNFSYSDCNSNIYNIVLLNALFAEYIQKESGTLEISMKDCEKIQKLFSSLSDDEISNIIYSTLSRLRYGNEKYNIKTIKNMMPEILNAVKYGKLHNCLTVTREQAYIVV